MKSLRRVVAGPAILLLACAIAGCASIIKGSGPEAIQLKSVPPGANCAIFDNVTGEHVSNVVTPGIAMLKKSRGFFKSAKYNINCAMEGKPDQQGYVDAGISGWYLGGNLVFGGLIGYLIVDPATGAMWTLEPETIHVNYDDPSKSVLNRASATDNTVTDNTAKTQKM